MPAGRAEMDMNSGPIVPPDDVTDQVIAHNVGAFLSDASHPTLIPPKSLMYTICCTGNCTPAMFWCWESIVRPSGEGATVRLLLNRASPRLDVDSFLPYEGRVELHVKTAKHVSVRMPPWVRLDQVRVQVDGQARTVTWADRYLVLGDLHMGNLVRVEFPVAEYQETVTLRWKQGDFWQEANDPGTQWTPDEHPTQYTFSFRGDTVVDVQPRNEGPGYRLYQRSAETAATSTLHSVERFIAPRLPSN